MGISLDQKNILVTGATGFVGSHLTKQLVSIGSNVIATSIETNPKSFFSINSLEKKVITLNADVTNYRQMVDIISKYNIDLVYHLAAQAIVETAYKNPRETIETNIMGTVNILEAVRQVNKDIPIVFASTDKAYGKCEKEKYIETDSLRGTHPYDVSKASADLICNSYVETYKMPVVITRFANIYGEGDSNYSRIIPAIMSSLLKKETLELRSDGTFTRDYLYVKDVVDGYILLAQNIDKTKGQAYNFGTSETCTVIQLIKKIEEILNTKIDYKVQNNQKNEIPYQSLDYTKVTTAIGWEPRQSLQESIPQIYSFYKKIHEM